MLRRRSTQPLLAAVLFIASAFLLEFVTAQGSCVTPNKRQGICIPILQCRLTEQILRAAPRPLPNHITKYLRDSHCGTFNGEHYGCCDQRSGNLMGTQPSSTVVPTQSAEIRPGVEPNEALNKTGMEVLDTEGADCSFYRLQVANGENTDLFEYQWVALLVYDDGVSKTLECGGSLITSKYVLTAAHCILVRQPKKLVAARLGEYDINSDVDCTNSTDAKVCAPPHQEIDIAQALYHKDYVPSRFANDIGLLRLRTPAVLNDAVSPICLPTPKNLKEAPVELSVAGWGNTERGTRANILQKATLPIVENEMCQRTYKVIPITDKHLCAGGVNATQSCRGDSGGPLFHSFERVQHGIVSGGSRQCGTNFPDVYTRVKPFLPWISSNIAALM